MARSLAVMHSFNSPFYAPGFVAVSQRHFADEDLDVTIRTAPRTAATVDALRSGEAQICLGGIMRSLEEHARAVSVKVYASAYHGSINPSSVTRRGWRSADTRCATTPRRRLTLRNNAARFSIAIVMRVNRWRCI